MMSEYLDQTPRTEQEALADICATEVKQILIYTDRLIRLMREMQSDLKLEEADNRQHMDRD